jgi:hypothetical protein
MKKNLNLIAAALVVCVALFIASCGTTDKCESVNCNSGICVDGTCQCDAGYEGTNCSSLINQKYLGSWKVVENPCAYDSCGKITNISCPNYTLSILENTSRKDKIIIKDLGNYGASANIQIPALLTGSTTFKLDSTYVGTSNPKALFIGEGSYVAASQKVIIKYTVIQGCERTSAVDTLSK